VLDQIPTSAVSRRSLGTGVSIAGAAVVGVAFGMVRHAFGLTLPDLRHHLRLSDIVVWLVAQKQ
jgi:fucose permease